MEKLQRYNRLLIDDEYTHLLCRLGELEADRRFCRHGITHLLDTARIMYIIALEEGLPYDKDIIYAAALVHDIGRVKQYEIGTPHNEASADIAGRLLPKCGYTSEETELICNAVRSHRSPVSDKDKSFGALLYRADKLSRLCFCCSAGDECYWSDERKNLVITL